MSKGNFPSEVENTITNVIDNASDIFSNKSQSYLLYSIISIIVNFSILILFFTWMTNTIGLKISNCKQYKKNYIFSKDNIKQKTLEQGNINHGRSKGVLRNYYIKTAFNCCNAGETYKNNWVSECALIYAIKMGARCLDFEIYSIDDIPCVASSTQNDFTVKETFNSIPLEDILNTIENPNNKYNYQGRTGEIIDDPLLLHFRIKSENTKMFNKMATIIRERIGNNLIPRQLASTTSLDSLKGKIIIMVQHPRFTRIGDFNFNGDSTDNDQLSDYINFFNNSSNLSESQQNGQYNFIKYSQIESEDNQILKNSAQADITFVAPDFNSSIYNYNYTKPLANGCQLIAMKFQQLDGNLNSYLKEFSEKNNGVSFWLKPPALRLDYIDDNVDLDNDSLDESAEAEA
jgi:hypothetical protein